MITPEEAEKIAKTLQYTVDHFNNIFKEWMEKNNCVAEFAWTYDRSGKKQLEVVSIDSIVYRRKPNKDFTTIKEALEKKV